MNLADVLITEELSRRPARPPDHAAESQALIALAREIAAVVPNLPQKLTDLACELCHAGSAGLSLLRTENGETYLHWPALSGAMAPHAGGRSPYEFSPCGATLKRQAPQLFSHPERYYTYLQEFDTTLAEVLVIPVYAAGRPLATIWIVSHDEGRHFDAEDVRLMHGLGEFAGAALALLSSKQELQESAGRLRVVQDNAPIGISENALDGRFLRVNDEFCKITGYPREELLALRFRDITHADDVERNVEAYRRAQAGEILNYHLEKRYIHRDGHAIWVELHGALVHDAAGNPSFGIGIVQDISERKRTEEALRQSAERFRTLANSIPQLAWMMRPDGYIFWYNQRWYDYTGTTLEQMQGWGWHSVHDPVELPRVVAKLQHSVATGEPWEDIFPLRRHDGEMRWHLSRMLPVRDEQYKIILWFGTNTDITEQREADRRKDEFLATLAHELRNPLAPLRTSLELMRIAANNPAVVAQAHATMERQVKQMVRLIDDLLDVSRITRGKIRLRKSRVELTALIKSAEETARPHIEQARHTLTVTLPPFPIYFHVDPTRLAQVFSNLLNNAAKYTNDGGRISLGAEQRGSELVVKVKDNGIGIAAAQLDSVFDMFAQADAATDRSRSGLGIGLTIAKRLIEMHGGTLEAKSAGPGQGSEFIVRLPLSTRSEQAPNARQEGEDGGRKHALRVLVVDDNKDAANVLSMMLELLGNQVRTAFDGVEALQAAAAFRPEVVLLDLRMPKLNGLDTARRMREQPWGRHLTLIALSGYGQEEDKRRTREAGFDHHLVKPVEPAVLQELLSAMRLGG